MRTITLAEIDAYIASQDQDESAYVKPASSYCDEIIASLHSTVERKVIDLPWLKSQGKFDLRPAEVTLWLGYNGHGKSLVLGQVVNGLMKQGQRCCIASFEMRPVSTLKRMCRQIAACKEPSEEYIRAFMAWTNDRLWIYDQFGTTPPQRVVNLGKFANSLGVQHLVVDSLMKVVQGEDDYNGQKAFVDQLCVLARDTGMHVHLIHHSRKGHDESRAPGKMDAKGSGAITDLVDNCVSVWRNKDEKRDMESPDCILAVDKQRHGEWEGKIGLFFHADSQGFAESSARRIAGFPLEIKSREAACPI